MSQPTLDDIIAYRTSPPIQQYLDLLLDKNREEGLTAEEREDMDQILVISQLMKVAKAKARLKLENQ